MTSRTIPFAAIVLAMLPAVLDQTILATALPTVATDLGQLSDVSWVVTVYVVAAAASTPLWGKLGDRHGRKLLLEVSLVVVVAASALCGATQDITQLIVLRAVQGAAAGGLMTLAMASVGDLVAPRERGRYQGYIAAAFAVATIVGPLLGGVLVDHASWRWVFFVNLPLGVVALTGLNRRLPAPETDGRGRPLDAAGAALVAGATSALMLACIWGGDRYAWDSPAILTLAAATVLLCAALVVRERRAEDPIVPLRLLRTPSVAIASAALFLGTAALFSITVFVPLFLQTATGASPTESGLLLIPAMLGITVSTTLSGRSIARTGRYKRFPILGFALMSVALLLLAALSARSLPGGHRRRRRSVRAWLRHGYSDPDRRSPEQRRPARAGHRDRHHRLLPWSRRRRRGGGPRRGVRCTGRLPRLRGHRSGAGRRASQRHHRRRAGGVPRRLPARG